MNIRTASSIDRELDPSVAKTLLKSVETFGPAFFIDRELDTSVAETLLKSVETFKQLSLWISDWIQVSPKPYLRNVVGKHLDSFLYR